ncbi:MAG: TetR/AcrR family transcriptional regulator [Chryseolinea sp.]
MEESEAKRKITKGAESLFMKYGVRTISMDDIARHLTVSKKTLYQHFEDKEDLVKMVCEAHIENIMQECQQLRLSSDNAIDEISKLQEMMRNKLTGMNPSFFMDLQKFHPTAWEVWIQHRQNFMQQSIIRNLRQGIDEGYFRPEIDLAVLAQMRMTLVQIPFDDKIYPPSHFKLADVQVQIFEHFVYGLLTDKGRKQYQKCKEKQAELTNP